jgi:hypothetical protein
MLKNLFNMHLYLAAALAWATILSAHITQMYNTEMIVHETGWEAYARFLVMTWILGISALIAWIRYFNYTVNS